MFHRGRGRSGTYPGRMLSQSGEKSEEKEQDQIMGDRI